jgi:signal transduction histidine kinase
MSPLEVLQLIGYSTAAALHLWVGALLVKRRHGLGRLERVLMILALAVGAWHACNLVITLHTLIGLDVARWKTFLRLINTLAVVGITLSYSLLLHSHLYLWANAKKRPLTRLERARVYLSYLPAAFLTIAVWNLWQEPYGPIYEKLSTLLFPFALWAVYCLCLVAGTDFLIARSTASVSERRLLKTLAASFVGIAALIFAVYVLKIGNGTAFGLYLQTFANLGSLVPTALLAYHIYRYHYLELIIKESLLVATLAGIVLIAYVYGIRTLGAWLTERYDLRPGIVESILILTLALVAAPLRNWLDRRFHLLFEREAALYRDVVTSIGANAGRYHQLHELLRFVEERITAGLGLRRVEIVVEGASRAHESDNAPELNRQEKNPPKGLWSIARGEKKSGDNQAEARQVETHEAVATNANDDWISEVLEISRADGFEPVEGNRLLRARGFEMAYPLRREDREVGLMLVDAAPDALTRDVRSVLEILAGQVALAIEDCRLVAENVQLERKLAQRERLAALGQMAATVAHEIRNPLSAIKSIVQVMREDEKVGREYARDLELIVGETDRLSRGVTQMLSFARNVPPPETPRSLGELMRSITHLFQIEAGARGVEVRYDSDGSEIELDGATVSALRDALSNLLLNALQVTPPGGIVRIEGRSDGGSVRLSVVDEGPGVAAEMRERIWEPFFTTKQRGTGLGLAIVRKRVEEIGGEARLAASKNGEGACFELRVPLPGKQ